MVKVLLIVAVTLVLPVLLNLLANDLWEASPRAAKRVVRLAARMWTRNPDEVCVYTEEWQAYIEDRPGKFLKLCTAAGFLVAAVGHRGLGQIRDQASTSGRSLRFPTIPLRFRAWVVETIGLLFLLATTTAANYLIVVSFIGALLGDSPWSLVYLAFGIATFMGVAAHRAFLAHARIREAIAHQRLL